MNVKKLREGLSLIREGHKILADGPLDFYIDQFLGTYEWIMKNLAPLEPGDRAHLLAVPEISEKKNWGLLHAKHFYVEGAICTVLEIECGPSGFICSVEFEADSRLDREGVVRPIEPKDRGRYRVNAIHLAKLSTI